MRALMAGAAGILAANALLSTVVGIRIVERESVLFSGLVVTAFSLGVMLGAASAAVVVRRVGHIRAFAAFCGSATVAAIGLLLIPQPVVWALLRVVIGYSAAGTYLVVESWLGAAFEPPRRGQAFAIYMVTCQLAMVAGQLATGLVGVQGAEPVALGSGLYAFALIPVALTRTPQPALPAPTRLGLVDLTRRAPLGVVGCTLAGAVVGTILNLGPVYGAGTGLDGPSTGVLMATLVGGGLILQAPVGWLSGRVDRRMLVGALAVGLCASATVAYVLPPFGQRVAGVVIGAFAFVLYPAALAHAQDRTDRSESVATSGTLILGYAIGATLAPSIGAYAMQAFGPRAYFPYVAALAAPLIIFALLRWRLERELRPETPAAFVAIAHPVTAPAGRPSIPLDLEEEGEADVSSSGRGAAPVTRDPSADSV